MKKLILLLAVVLVAISCNNNPKTATIPQSYSNNIRFCESVLFHGDTMLVANFGTQELNPLNTEGRGYILSFSDTTSTMLICADGNLSAPKGMLIHNNRLYIADVGKMVVYDLGMLNAAPQVVEFPEGELFVNDMDIDNTTETLYITVTNTGNIYSMNISSPDSVSHERLEFYTNVMGANGIVIRNGAMYIASYPADGNTTPDNVIYYIEDITQPQPTPLVERPGQYDGLALSEDGKTLYFNNWENSELGCINLATSEVTLLNPNITAKGAARMQLKNGVLYIPDLPTSRVLTYKIGENEEAI